MTHTKWRLVSATVLTIAVGQPASAACIRSGSTVMCSAATFESFITQDSVTLTVGRDAFVSNVPAGGLPLGNCPLSPPVLSVGRASVVVNQGQLVGTGVCATAIFTGDGSTVRNDGFIATIDILAHGVDAGDDSTVTHGGRIQTAAQSAYGIFVGERGRVTTTPGSSIETAGVGGSGIVAGGGGVIDVSGTIMTAGSLASGIDTGAGATTVSGTLTSVGIGSVGVRAAGDGTIVNGGTITGQRNAIVMTVASAATIVNRGTLRTEATFADSGAVIGLSSAPAAAIRIENRGSIVSPALRPAISGGDGNELVDNFGRIEGDIRLGGGSDSVSLHSGSSVAGQIDLGPGDDQLFLAGNGTLSAAIVGAEVLNKSEPGTWVLAAEADIARNTVILGGALSVAGRLTSTQVATLGSGKLTGTGIINGAVLNTGIVDVPQGAHLTIIGPYTQDQSGVLRTALTAAGSAPLVVSGAMTLAGTLDPGFLGRRVSAGETFALASGTSALSGQFTTIAGLSPSFLRGNVERAVNGDVRLMIARLPYRSAATSQAAINLAKALDLAIARNSSGLGPLFDYLDGLTTADASGALDRLSPTIPAAVVAASRLAGRSSATAIMQWLELGPSDSVPGSFRSWGQIGRRGGSDQAFRIVTEQIVAGVDTALANGTRIGFSLVGQNGRVRSQSDVTRATTDTTTVAAYAGHVWSRWRIAASAMLSDGSPRWQRQGLFGRHTAETDFTLAQGQFVATYATSAGPFLVKSSLSVSADRSQIGSFAETGVEGLSIPRQSRTSVRPGLGLRIVATPGTWHPFVSMAVAHDLNRGHPLRAAFAADQRAEFDLAGPALRRTDVTVQAGVNIELGPGLMARIGCDGIVNEPLADRGIAVGLSYRW